MVYIMYVTKPAVGASIKFFERFNPQEFPSIKYLQVGLFKNLLCENSWSEDGCFIFSVPRFIFSYGSVLVSNSALLFETEVWIESLFLF